MEDEDAEEPAEAVLSRFTTLEADVRTRTAETERRLQRYPDDIETWISYSALHLRLSPDITGQPASVMLDTAKLPQIRANAEVTLSILARALYAHPSNMASSILHAAYLHAAEAFWPAQKVTDRWKNVLRELRELSGQDNRDSIMSIWLGYIEWIEGQGFGKSADGRDSAGGVDGVIDVYAQCIASLDGERTTGSPTPLFSEFRLTVFKGPNAKTPRRNKSMSCYELAYSSNKQVGHVISAFSSRNRRKLSDGRRLYRARIIYFPSSDRNVRPCKRSTVPN